MSKEGEMDKATLYNNEGTSDKVYVMWIEQRDGGYVVPVQYGRRGGPMQNGMKTKKPVSLAEARKVFTKKLKEQLGKGYREGQDAPAYSQVAGAVDTGIRPMLLTTATEDDLERFLTDERWGAQEKKNGKHIFARALGNRVTGINKKGLECPIPVELEEALKGHHMLFEGELINNVLHAFDLPAAGLDLSADYRVCEYGERDARLRKGTEAVQAPDCVKAVPLAIGEGEKRALLTALREGKKEGIVFKLLSAPYVPGKIENLKKAVAVKVKFWKSGEFVVDEVPNGKQSVRLVAFDGTKRIPVGSCTVPTKYLNAVTQGRVVQVKYLYATSGGQLYQASLDPDDNGHVVRDDKDPRECTIGQLQFEGTED